MNSLVVAGIRVGDYITAEALGSISWQRSGQVVYIISPREMLSEYQIRQWCDIGPDHKDYRSLQGRYTKVYRLVFTYDEQYCIVPVSRRVRIERC